MAKRAIKMLGFDVFGTVVDWYSSVIAEGESLAQNNGIDGVDWGAFTLAWRGRYGPSMQPIIEGERPWVRLDVLHYESLLATLDEFGIDQLTDAQINDFNRAWHRLNPWPDSVAGLTRLKQRFILATVSNGNIELMVNMAKRAGLPWDVVLGAEPTKQYKPHPETYLGSAEIMGLAPEDCMMVAAHTGDLDAARSLGFSTAYVHRPDEFGPEQHIDMPDPSAYDIVVTDFEKLAEQLGC